MSASSTLFWLLVSALVVASIVFGSRVESRRDAAKQIQTTDAAE